MSFKQTMSRLGFFRFAATFSQQTLIYALLPEPKPLIIYFQVKIYFLNSAQSLPAMDSYGCSKTAGDFDTSIRQQMYSREPSKILLTLAKVDTKNSTKLCVLEQWRRSSFLPKTFINEIVFL